MFDTLLAIFTSTMAAISNMFTSLFWKQAIEFKKEASEYKSKVKMLPINEKEPNSRSWIRIDDDPETVVDDCKTVDEMIRKAIRLFGDKKTFGVRTILQKENKKKGLS